MGRKFPSNVVITSIHPILSLALIITWVVAMVATVSGLCGMCSKKSSKSLHKEEKKNNVRIKTIMTSESTSNSSPSKSQDNTNIIDNTTTTTTDDDGGLPKPLPPPPAATKLEFGDTTGNKKTNRPSKIDKSQSSLQNYMSKGSTRRKLSASLSMRMSMKIKDKASDFKDKASELSYVKAKHDADSLWNKRIILGEKCRLPNEVDDEVISIDDDFDDEHFSILDEQPIAISRSVSSLNHGVDSSVNEEHSLITTKEKEKEKE